MKQRLIFATGNEHKMKEIREILDESKYEIISMKEAGVDIDIVEDGKTFEENGRKNCICCRKILCHGQR